jgi:hypothetical protein
MLFLYGNFLHGNFSPRGAEIQREGGAYLIARRLNAA